MAQGNAVRNLREEATCAVCLDFFRRPVMLLPCGHNFCRSCVAAAPKKAKTGPDPAPCAASRSPPGGFCPNRQLANVVAVVRELVEGEDLGLGGDLERRVPPAEPLEDREPTPSSSRPQEHLGPPQNKRQEDERAATLLTPPGGAQQSLMARVEAERQKLLAVLGGLRGLVGQQESWLLARLGHLRRGLEEAKGWNGGGNPWDAGVAPSSTEQRPRPLELEAELEDFSQKNNALEAVVERLKDVLACSLEEDLGGYQKASVTLDPATAHPKSWCPRTAAAPGGAKPLGTLLRGARSVSRLFGAFWAARVSPQDGTVGRWRCRGDPTGLWGWLGNSCPARDVSG
ncbi:E3 ubiquitin-protein ligase TRIM7-like isoform X3 [Anas acuta]|uniref:E3 ubiquitin-protein ligase TRIM7-like isoform X3 n=1 Tax=Anas acuta TaxID=28680 RepID=UPI0035C8AF0A